MTEIRRRNRRAKKQGEKATPPASPLIDKSDILDIAQSPYEEVDSSSSGVESESKKTNKRSNSAPVSAKRKRFCGCRLFTFRRLFLAFVILSFYGASVCPPVDQLDSYANDPDIPKVCSAVAYIPKFNVFQAWYQSRLGPKVEQVHKEHIKPAAIQATQIYRDTMEPHVIEVWESEIAPIVVPIYKDNIEPKLQRAGKLWGQRLQPIYSNIERYSILAYDDYLYPAADTISHTFTEYVKPQLDTYVWPNYNQYVAPHAHQSIEWVNARIHEQVQPWLSDSHEYYLANVAPHVNKLIADTTEVYHTHIAPTILQVYNEYAHPYGKKAYTVTKFVIVNHVGPAVRDYVVPATKHTWYGTKHVYIQYLHPHAQTAGQKVVELYNEYAAATLNPYIEIVRNRGYDVIAYAGFVPTQAEIDEERAILEAEERAKAEALRKQRAREEAERKAKKEAERKAKEEAERKAREEAERKAKEEAERKAKEEAERKAKEAAERKRKEEERKKEEKKKKHAAKKSKQVKETEESSVKAGKKSDATAKKQKSAPKPATKETKETPATKKKETQQKKQDAPPAKIDVDQLKDLKKQLGSLADIVEKTKTNNDVSDNPVNDKLNDLLGDADFSMENILQKAMDDAIAEQRTESYKNLKQRQKEAEEADEEFDMEKEKAKMEAELSEAKKMLDGIFSEQLLGNLGADTTADGKKEETAAEEKPKKAEEEKTKKTDKASKPKSPAPANKKTAKKAKASSAA